MLLRKRIAIFGSFLTGSQSVEYRMADDLGYRLAAHGFTVMCGGNGGITSALISGVTRGGGEVTGVSLSAARYPNRGTKPDPRLKEPVFATTIGERLDLFAAADGYIFFPGGIGSLAEFAFIWHSLQVAADFTRPVILVSGAWKRIMAAIRHEQLVKSKYYRQLFLCGDVEEAMAVLTNDYSITYDGRGRMYHKECVLFNLDGTIVESPEEEFVRACEDIGYFFHLPDVIASFLETEPLRRTTRGGDDISHTLAVLEHLGIEAESATGIAEHVRSESGQMPRLYADAPDTLRYFKENGFSTAVYSFRPSRQLEEILQTHGLSALFETVVSLDLSGGSPGRSPFVEALERLGFHPGEVLHVGVYPAKENRGPVATEVDSIVLDRYLTHILDDTGFKIRSLGELTYLVKSREAGRDVQR